ncbi:MAG: hypothetical protein NZ921_02180 [Candidatus Caldarchaeum sp.]|nr:hypothetical protein [Candidatus Caldarchaeum sp.]
MLFFAKYFSFVMMVSLALLGVSAQPDSGSFFRYGYQVSSSDGETYAGTFTLLVVEKLSDRELRLRFEATFNDGIATIEKNLPAQLFAPPALDFEALAGVYGITKEGGNVSYSFSLQKTGEDRRAVGGISYVTNTYSFTAYAKHKEISIRLDGEAETIAESNVIYQLSSRITSGDKTYEYRLFLVDCNVDLRQFKRWEDGGRTSAALAAFLASATGDSQLGSHLNALSTLHSMRGGSQSTVEEKPVPTVNAQTERVALFGMFGVAALAAVAVTAFRMGRKGLLRGERKAHYV